MRNFLRLLAWGAACATPAYAATATDQFSVTATVVASCGVVAQDLSFGNYDPVSSTPLDASATLDVTCTNGAGYQVGLDDGATAGGTIATRKMVSGANTLDYTLYSNAGRTTVWGDVALTNTVAGTGTGSAQTLTVYGRISANQTAPAGAYSDTITVTVTY